MCVYSYNSKIYTNVQVVIHTYTFHWSTFIIKKNKKPMVKSARCCYTFVCILSLCIQHPCSKLYLKIQNSLKLILFSFILISFSKLLNQLNGEWSSHHFCFVCNLYFNHTLFIKAFNDVHGFFWVFLFVFFLLSQESECHNYLIVSNIELLQWLDHGTDTSIWWYVCAN